MNVSFLSAFSLSSSFKSDSSKWSRRRVAPTDVAVLLRYRKCHKHQPAHLALLLIRLRAGHSFLDRLSLPYLRRFHRVHTLLTLSCMSWLVPREFGDSFHCCLVFHFEVLYFWLEIGDLPLEERTILTGQVALLLLAYRAFEFIVTHGLSSSFMRNDYRIHHCGIFLRTLLHGQNSSLCGSSITLSWSAFCCASTSLSIWVWVCSRVYRQHTQKVLRRSVGNTPHPSGLTYDNIDNVWALVYYRRVNFPSRRRFSQIQWELCFHRFSSLLCSPLHWLMEREEVEFRSVYDLFVERAGGLEIPPCVIVNQMLRKLESLHEGL